MSETATFWLTLVIFSLTYVGLAFGKLPGLRTDRTGIALAGSAAVLACGLLTFDDAVNAVDFPTIALLLGMMIVVAFLRRAGFFTVLAAFTLNRFRSPPALLGIIMLLSGILSALLVNDVICLALTPLVLRLTRHLQFDPKPHLIGLAIASNVGSSATLTGNPQNMIIGGLSNIGYLRFAAKLAPVAVLGLAISYAITFLMFRSILVTRILSDETRSNDVPPNGASSRPLRSTHRALLVKSVLVTLATIALFFAGAPMAVVALGAAAILLLDRVQPDGVYRQIDWGLLLMFTGLFVVVRAFEIHVLNHAGIENWTMLQEQPIGLLSAVSAIVSNLVSNVPAVLMFKPVIPLIPSGMRETAWLALAMSSTLAGNLTVLGSVANLIVVENARKESVAISLAEYCRVGIPVTLTTLLLGTAWLHFVHY